jgi:hypothetical protein
MDSVRAVVGGTDMEEFVDPAAVSDQLALF